MEIGYSIAGALAVIEFDGVVREQHLGSAVVTEHTVEKGANISDHVKPELDRLTVDAVVTNAPIRVPSTNTNGISGGVGDLPLTVTVKESLPIGIPGVGAALAGSGVLDSNQTLNASVLQFDGEFDRPRSVYDELSTLKDSGTLVTVATSLRDYSDMVIKTLSAPRAAGEGDAITFSIEIQHLRFVETKTVPAPKDPKTPAAKKNLGAKPPVPEDNESLAHKIKTKIFGR